MTEATIAFVLSRVVAPCGFLAPWEVGLLRCVSREVCACIDDANDAFVNKVAKVNLTEQLAEGTISSGLATWLLRCARTTTVEHEWKYRWYTLVAMQGRTSVLEYMLLHSKSERNVPSVHALVGLASSGGHLHTLRWLRHEYSPSSFTSSSAHDVKTVWMSCCRQACAHGQDGVLEWALSDPSCYVRRHPFQMFVLTHLAVYTGNLHALELFGEALPHFERTGGGILLCAACVSGRVDVLEWMTRHAARRGWGAIEWTEDACNTAASHGNLDVVIWLRRTPCRWSEWTCYEAALHGRLRVLRWLHRSGCPWSERTFDGAADGGHVRVLRWLWRRGCPLSSSACTHAAQSGHLGALRWLRETAACPWELWAPEVGVLDAAAARGHVHVLRYALLDHDDSEYDGDDENETTDDDDETDDEDDDDAVVPVAAVDFVVPAAGTADLCATAARHDQWATVRWLREECRPPRAWAGTECMHAVRFGRLAELRWMREECDPPCPWEGVRSELCVLAAKEDHWFMLPWLRAQGCEWGDFVWIQQWAVARGHEAVNELTDAMIAAD